METEPTLPLTEDKIQDMRHMRDRAMENHEYFGTHTLLGRHWGKVAALMTLLILHETGALK
jgi:hypothetical protein